MASETNLHASTKFLDESSDHIITMIDSGAIILLISAISAGICVLCLYSVYGNVIRHETTLHDLRNRVETLQNKQTLHLALLKGEIKPDDFGDVVIVEDEEESPAPELSEDIEMLPTSEDDHLSAVPVSSSTNAA